MGDTSGVSIRRRSSARRPGSFSFILTGFDKNEKGEQNCLILKIKSLKGLYSESFEMSTTHIICKKPTRSEKFLAGCSTGKWILNESYIEDSYRAQEWLQELNYEWDKKMMNKVAASPESVSLLSVPRQCRLLYSGPDRGPFLGWNVALHVKHKNKHVVYKSILEYGGAYVSSLVVPLSPTSDLTHVIMDDRINTDENLVKQLRGIACVPPVYIGDYITSFPKPKLEGYLLPKGSSPIVTTVSRMRSNSQSSSSSQSSRSSRLSARLSRATQDSSINPKVAALKSEKNSPSLGTSPLSKCCMSNARSMAIDKVQADSTSSAGSTPVSTPTKQIGLTSSQKSLVSPSKITPKTRVKRKSLKHKPDPSQGIISTFFAPCKKEEKCVSLSQSSVRTMNGKTSEVDDDDVVIIEPEDAVDLFSPIKTRSRRSMMSGKAANGSQIMRQQPESGDACHKSSGMPVSRKSSKSISSNSSNPVPVSSKSSKIIISDSSKPIISNNSKVTSSNSINPVAKTSNISNPVPGSPRRSQSDVTHSRSSSQPETSCKPAYQECLYSSQPSLEDKCLKATVKLTRCMVDSPRLKLDIPTAKSSAINSKGKFVAIPKALDCRVLLSRYKFSTETQQQKDDFVESRESLARLEGKVLDSSADSFNSESTNTSSHSKNLSVCDSSVDEVNVSKSDASDTHLEPSLSEMVHPAKAEQLPSPHQDSKLDDIKSNDSYFIAPKAMGDNKSVISKDDYLAESPQIPRPIRTRQGSAALKSRSLKRKSSEIPSEITDKPIPKKQKFRARLPWIPLCHMNQCHDDADEDSEKVLALPLSGTEASVLAIAMEYAEEQDISGSLKTIYSVRSVVSTCRYPSAETLSQLMNKLIYLSKDKYVANRAYTVLCHLLELHPPRSPALQKVYLAALNEHENMDVGHTQEWNFIQKVISGALAVEVESRQEQHNCYLLLKYIVAIIQKDFNHIYSPTRDAQTRRGIPLLAHIVWPNGLKMMNSVCQDLIMNMVLVVQIEEYLPYKMELSRLLQSLVYMTAHCISVTGNNTTWRSLDTLPEQTCLFARELAYRINGGFDDGQKMSVVLKSLQPPWLTFKVTHMLLDLYDDSMLPLDLSHPSEKLKSLKSLLDYYSYLVPPPDRLSVISPHKKTDGKPNRAFKILSQSNHVQTVTKFYSAITEVSHQEVTNSLNQVPSLTKRSRKETLCASQKSDAYSNAALKRKMTTINKRNSKGETPLHMACMKNNAVKVRELLQVPGVNVNMTDFAGWTPLHEACNHGFVECVLELLKYRPPRKITSYFKSDTEELQRVDLCKTNSDGITALHDAVMNNHMDITRILVQHGGDTLTSMRTVTGQLPFDLAISDEMKQVLETPISTPLIMSDLSFSQESACSQCSQGPSCPAKKQLQVTEEKYSDVIPAGCGVSENQCSRYVLLFHHLVKAYVKFYDLISVSRASKFGVEPTAESEPPSDAVDSQLCGELHEDVKTLRHLKTYCKLFEKHLRCLSPDMGDSPRLIQMLYLIVECSAGQ